MKRRWKLGLVFLVPLMLYGYIVERNSWRPKTIEVDTPLEGPLSFSPDGRYLAVPSFRKSGTTCIYLCDVKSRNVIGQIEGATCPYFLTNQLLAAVYRPDDEHQRHTRIYSVPNGKLMASSPQNFIFFSSTDEGLFLLGNRMSELQAFLPNLSSNGEAVYSWDWRFPSILNLTSYDALSPEAIRRAEISSVYSIESGFCISADGALVAGQTSNNSGFGRSFFGVWDTKTGQLIRSLKVADGSGYSTFSHDNRALAITSSTGIELWRIK
jgi:WD40 repeat protein